MPVQRFRDLETARRALWTAATDPALPGRIRKLWQFSARLTTPCPARGVRRFRTIEEANAEREHRLSLRIAAVRAERAEAAGTYAGDHSGRSGDG